MPTEKSRKIGLKLQNILRISFLLFYFIFYWFHFIFVVNGREWERKKRFKVLYVDSNWMWVPYVILVQMTCLQRGKIHTSIHWENFWNVCAKIITKTRGKRIAWKCGEHRQAISDSYINFMWIIQNNYLLTTNFFLSLFFFRVLAWVCDTKCCNAYIYTYINSTQTHKH